ncbi:MAG: Hsp20/alpha crystallin family protein [Alphaproteobacteria bacterium]|nr:Hsp20/alpha crystallin family protein [Alphaproteobacteria bacterium]MBU4039972.1 Hsp20/alpha crystallin family protein [Alphaproteobacteria bacterium]MBU4135552.1 Hsp20/alpha crystallin family protein [Alphaproteobacteria bacterium]
MPAPSTPAAPASAMRAVAPFFAPLQREFDRVLADFSGFDLSDVFGPSPRVDLRETKEGVELTAELPGLTEKDIHVDLQDDVLTISGEKKTSTETHDKDFRMTERRYGAFSRSVRLPAAVQADKVKASLKQGVLTVTAPFDAAATARKVAIPVKSA